MENQEETQEEKIEFTVVKPYDDSVIAEHAAKCGGQRNVIEIIIETDDNYQFYYLVKRPTKTVMQAIAEISEKPESKKLQTDVTQIQKLMLGCILEGDRDAYEHDGLIYTQLLKRIGQLVNKSKDILKK